MVKEVDPKDKQAAVPALNPEIVRESGGEVMPQRPQEIEDWRTEFPYPWDEDEVVTRRDTLRFLLGGSGALFLATGVLAIIGNLPSGPGVKAVPIAKGGELGENQGKMVEFPRSVCPGHPHQSAGERAGRLQRCVHASLMRGGLRRQRQAALPLSRRTF